MPPTATLRARGGRGKVGAGSGRWWPGAAGGGHAVECSCGQGCEPAEAVDDAGALEQPAEMDQPG